MTDPPKKFTFGFSKIAKKSNIVNAQSSSKEKSTNVEYITGVEGNTIKLQNETAKEESPLVIPIIGPKKSSTLTNGKTIAEIVENFDSLPNPSLEKPDGLQPNDAPETLETKAAREILQEAQGLKVVEESVKLENLPQSNLKDVGERQKESTLEDYENIPVSQFGLAMLRGMGWKEDEGIGKNKKVVAVSSPSVRPKGMGLGADKVANWSASSKVANNTTQGNEELRLVKEAFVRVLAGRYKDQYAQVEGFDDEGRVILKAAIGGTSFVVSEAVLELVTQSEFKKYSKILNVEKFEKFKNRSEGVEKLRKEEKVRECDSSSSEEMERKDQSRRKYDDSPVRVKRYEQPKSDYKVERSLSTKDCRKKDSSRDDYTKHKSSDHKSKKCRSPRSQHRKQRERSYSPEERKKGSRSNDKRRRHRSRSSSSSSSPKRHRKISSSDSDSYLSRAAPAKKKKKGKRSRRSRSVSRTR